MASILLKTVVTILLVLMLIFIGEQAYGAFVLGNQLVYGSFTASAVTVLTYLVPGVGIVFAIAILWRKGA